MGSHQALKHFYLLKYFQEAVEALAEMYSLLKEEDMWAALWQRHKAKYAETGISLAYAQQGYFDQAQGAVELAMTKGRQDHASSPAPYALQAEYRLWEDFWIRCSQELNQWETIVEYGSTVGNPWLILDGIWRSTAPNWTQMKEALSQVEQACPKDLAWKVRIIF